MPDSSAHTSARYHRQQILPAIGSAGMARLRQAGVLLIGAGALGGTIADQLVRAGIGRLRLVDRDLVDWTNLHRQVLFSEQDARQSAPKAIAAARRLAEVNSQVAVEPLVVDVHAGNIELLAGCGSDGQVDLILDGTDNAETRYLINDVAVKHGIPWVYGACVGTEGRVMPILPGVGVEVGPCLRCLFPQAPQAGELATCDTAGVLGPAAAAVASLQAAAAIRILVEGRERGSALRLLALDAWTLGVRELDMAHARAADCVCCGKRQFEYLARPVEAGAAALCGRSAVQVRGGIGGGTLDLAEIARRLAAAGQVQAMAYMVRCRLTDLPGLTLSVFADGRTIVDGTTDIAQARSLVARYVGA